MRCVPDVHLHLHHRPARRRVVVRRRRQRRDVAVVDDLLPVAQLLEPREHLEEALVVELVAELLEPLPERVTPRVLAEHQHAAVGADRLRRHDLVRRAVLEHAVLMDARLVRERVGADDRLVRRDVRPRALLQQPRGARELRRVDARVRAGEQLGARVQRHHDLLERRVARALADAVHRHLDLPRAGADAGQRVRDREAEVVVAVRRDDDAGMLRRQLDDAAIVFSYSHGRRVADGVRDVQRRRAALDHGGEHVEQVLGIGARRVLRRELDLVHEPLARATPPSRPRAITSSREQRSLCCRWMSDVARKMWIRLRAAGRHRRGAGPDVVLGRPRQPADRRAVAAPHLLGHRLDRLRITGRGGGIARLDHVHAESRELVRDLELLVQVMVQPGACSPSRSVVSKTRTRSTSSPGVRTRLASGLTVRRPLGGRLARATARPAPWPETPARTPTCSAVRSAAAHPSGGVGCPHRWSACADSLRDGLERRRTWLQRW